MTRSVHRVASTVLGLFLGLASFALLASAPASAADTNAVIDHAQPTKGAVRLLVSVPGTEAVDYDKVGVKIDGNTVGSQAVAASTTNVERTSILAIDTSNSMKGTRITEAKKAEAKKELETLAQLGDRFYDQAEVGKLMQQL